MQKQSKPSPAFPSSFVVRFQIVIATKCVCICRQGANIFEAIASFSFIVRPSIPNRSCNSGNRFSYASACAVAIRRQQLSKPSPNLSSMVRHSSPNSSCKSGRHSSYLNYVASAFRRTRQHNLNRMSVKMVRAPTSWIPCWPPHRQTRTPTQALLHSLILILATRTHEHSAQSHHTLCPLIASSHSQTIEPRLQSSPELLTHFA
jgi:hypothetical protein